MTGDRIIRQRIGVVTVIVMMVDVLEQTANVFAQRVIQNERRALFCQPDRLRLLQHLPHPTVIDLFLLPAIGGEISREVGLIGTLQHTARNIGHALVRQYHQSR